MSEKIYRYCDACGGYMYREPGKRHSAWQQDTNDNPVWLFLSSVFRLTSEEQKGAATVRCGCDG